MAGHHDPRVLYSIENIRAYHIQNGQQQELNPSGPQTMSLLMVPTSSPFADLSNANPQDEVPEEDFYLHLHLPPELDQPLPATTQIYHQPPRSYLIPRWDLGPESGAFTRIEFPEKFNQDDVDTFETILAQCTAFLERAPPPTGDASHKAYNPADWAAGNSRGGGKTEPGHIVLIDEENGSVVGELAEGAQVVEDPGLSHGSKRPVEIEVSSDGKRVMVANMSEDYLQMAKHPAYKSSGMVQNAAAASRLIVTGSGYLGNLMASGANSFTQKTKPVDKSLTFKPETHERVRRIHTFTTKTAGVSSKTVGQATKIGQNVGAKLTGKNAYRPKKGFNKEGKADEEYKPGLLNRSMIAFSTVADGLAEGGRSLLTTSGSAASTMVGHRYGEEAGGMAAQLAGGVKNVGLVYIDVTGVSRRAVIKSVAKGMVIGRVKGGGEVVVGGGDGGAIPEQDMQKMGGNKGATNESTEMHQPPVTEEGFGSRMGGPPPAYSSELGEPMGSSSLQGKKNPEFGM